MTHEMKKSKGSWLLNVFRYFLESKNNNTEMHKAFGDNYYL